MKFLLIAAIVFLTLITQLQYSVPAPLLPPWNEAKTYFLNIYRHRHGLLLRWLLGCPSTFDNVSLPVLREKKDGLARSSTPKLFTITLRSSLLHSWSSPFPLWLHLCHYAHSWGSWNGRLDYRHYVSHLEGISGLKRSGALCSRSGRKFRGVPWSSHWNQSLQLGGLLWCFPLPVSAHSPDHFLPLRLPLKQRLLTSEPKYLTWLLRYL